MEEKAYEEAQEEEEEDEVQVQVGRLTSTSSSMSIPPVFYCDTQSSLLVSVVSTYNELSEFDRASISESISYRIC